MNMDNLPPPDNADACARFKARLCPDLWLPDRPPLVSGKGLNIIEDKCSAMEVDNDNDDSGLVG